MASDDDDHPRLKNRRRNGQFLKGLSGNSRGRPPAARSIRSVFQKMLASKIVAESENGPVVRTMVEAMAARVKKEALVGTLRALERGIAVAEKYSLTDPAPREKPISLSALSEDEKRELLRLIDKLDPSMAQLQQLARPSAIQSNDEETGE